MTVDISPVVQAIVGLAATALGIIGSAVLMKLNTKLHLQISAGQQEAFDSALKKALIYGATKATSEIAAKGWDHPQVHSEVVSMAMQQRLIPLTQVPTISSGRARTRLHASHHIWG
jgi:hypothetical protein